MTNENTVSKINAILDEEHLVETNEGTFGSEEACRKVGTGEPAFANYRVYKTLRGAVRHVGAVKDNAPGYPRHFAVPKLDKAKIAEMAKKVLESAETIVREAKRWGRTNQASCIAAEKEIEEARAILSRYGK